LTIKLNPYENIYTRLPGWT